MLRNYYQTLGISENATIEEIKVAYKVLAKKYHPDLNKDPNAPEWFKRIKTAYDFLMNPVSKRELDNALANRKNNNIFTPSTKYNDVMSFYYRKKAQTYYEYEMESLREKLRREQEFLAALERKYRTRGIRFHS